MSASKKSTKASPKKKIVPLKPPKHDAVVAAKPAKEPKAPKTPAEPKALDARLPPVGTRIEKKDRHGAGRCHCEVVEGGIRYAGTTYKSISAAAMQAATDLGLTNKTQNGFTFWGLSKPKAAIKDPVEAIASAFATFESRMKIALAACTDDNREMAVQCLKDAVAAIGEAGGFELS